MTKHLKIIWLQDSYDCETCGTTCADGAMVYLDGELLLELIPHAFCYDGDDWDRDKVYEMIFEKLGYTSEAGYDDL